MEITTTLISLLVGLALACQTTSKGEMMPSLLESSIVGNDIISSAESDPSSFGTADTPSLSLDLAIAPPGEGPFRPPILPASFFGAVTIDGSGAPEGTIITVGSDGTPYANTTTFLCGDVPVYRVDVPADNPLTTQVREGGTEGEMLEFTVNGTTTAQKARWYSASNQKCSLMVGDSFVYIPFINGTQ
ncbi:MAG: hypothetical protein A2Y73_09320 [Chloroflexi bacterium RBG_13_56_8]|nr:MAG: hypothetical protein A2Y73_09320 [Chloroflexi bacterium RBG_13_56_8]